MTSKLAVLLALLMAFQCVALADKQSAVVNDDTITDRVRLKLASDPDVKGGALQVDVKQGVVTLSGAVELPKQKDKAEKLARKIKGVKSVVNNIEIKARVPAK